MREKRLFLKVSHHFNLAEIVSSSKSVLDENVVNELSPKPRSQIRSSISVTDYIKVVKLDDFMQEVAHSKKAVNIYDNTTPSSQRKTNQGAILIGPNDKTTMDIPRRNPLVLEKSWRYRRSERYRLQRQSRGLWYILDMIAYWDTNCQLATRNHRKKLIK